MNEAKLREVLARFVLEFGTGELLFLALMETDWYAWGSRQVETDGLLTALDNAGWMHECIGSDGFRYTQITDKALAFIKGEAYE